MEDPSDTQGYQVQYQTPAESHQNMLLQLPVHRELPTDTEYQRYFSTQCLQRKPLHPNLQMSSYALNEHGFEKCQKPEGNLCPQRLESHPVSPGIPMQSSSQCYLVPMSNLSSQICPGSQVPNGTTMQSNFHSYLVTTGNICQQTSQSPIFPTKTPISRSPLLSSCYSGRCSVSDSPEFLDTKDTYGDSPPESKKKIRISYSKEQKLLLEKYFEKCRHPRRDERGKLAQMIGVTDQQIQVWFKNRRVKYKKKYLHIVQEGVPETSGNSTAESGSTISNGHLPVLPSINGEAMSLGTCSVGSIPNLKPCLEGSPYGHQAYEGARYSPKVNMLHFESPNSASSPSLPKRNEALSDTGLTREAALPEAPLLMAPTDQEPERAKVSSPSLEERYQQIIEDFI